LKGGRREAKGEVKAKVEAKVEVEIEVKVKSSGSNTHVTLDGYPTSPADYGQGQRSRPKKTGNSSSLSLAISTPLRYT
jgi:hypothetical protein